MINHLIGNLCLQREPAQNNWVINTTATVFTFVSAFYLWIAASDLKQYGISFFEFG